MQFKALVVLVPFLLSPVMAMGKATDALADFINGIPAADLQGFPTSAGTVYKTSDFRLDMQGLTTARKGQPQAHNLQIQANKESSVKQIAKMAPATVAGPVLVPVAEPWTAEKVRTAFLNSKKI